VCERRVDLLVRSLPLHRHSYIGFILAFASSIHNKQHIVLLWALTHTRRTDGVPEPDGALKTVARTKILHYRQLYLNRPDPIVFIPATVDTRVYDDCSHLLFLHAHREVSALANEIPEESEQFRFLRVACYANIKGSVGLILGKTSVMRISIPLDLSSRYLSHVS
jgi:hypothetical protein